MLRILGLATLVLAPLPAFAGQAVSTMRVGLFITGNPADSVRTAAQTTKVAKTQAPRPALPAGAPTGVSMLRITYQ